MRLIRRLELLERHAGRVGDVTWAEYFAASQRVGLSALAKLDAALDGRPPPEGDSDQDQRDSETFRRWSRQQGVDFEREGANAGEDLERKLRAMRFGECA